VVGDSAGMRLGCDLDRPALTRKPRSEGAKTAAVRIRTAELLTVENAALAEPDQATLARRRGHAVVGCAEAQSRPALRHAALRP
jgi:hypothetical protein